MEKTIRVSAEFDKQYALLQKDIRERNEKKSGHPMFNELLIKMGEIHDAKNSDYAGGNPLGNFMEAEGFNVNAFKGVLIRLSDKYIRIKSLSVLADMKGKVKDESIEDTLIDLANYALIAIIIRRKINV